MNYPTAIAHTVRLLDLWLPQKIRSAHIPGLAVGIVYKGKLLYAQGFGFADQQRKLPVTPKSQFAIASMSKSFTAIAVLQLADRKLIALDDAVSKALPKLAKTPIANVTLRQLLSHTAGILRDGTTPHWTTSDFPTAEQLYADASRAKVFANPARFKYSNYGYALLGEVIAAVSGMSYEEYVRMHILEPLGMHDTVPDFSATTVHHSAKGYERVIPGKAKPDVFSGCPARAYAAATGFVSTIDDLARYLAAFTTPNDTICPAIVRAMRKKHAKVTSNKTHYGLGVDIFALEKRPLIGHSGGYPGFSSRMNIDLANSIGIVTIGNSNHIPVGNINQGILEAIYTLVDAKKVNGKPIARHAQCEGIYQCLAGDYGVLSMGNHFLTFDPNSDSPLQKPPRILRKGEHLVLDTPYEYDHDGEIISFIFDNDDEPASTVMWGPNPVPRLQA